MELLLNYGADPGFAKGEMDHGEQGARAYNGSLGVEPPAVGIWGQSSQQGPGAEPLVGVRGKAPDDESFLSIFIKKRSQKLSI